MYITLEKRPNYNMVNFPCALFLSTFSPHLLLMVITIVISVATVLLLLEVNVQMQLHSCSSFISVAVLKHPQQITTYL